MATIINQLMLPIKFAGMMLAQQLGPQRLARIPEPEAITDAEQNVLQYDQVMNTKLALAYASGLEVIHRAREPIDGGSAIDVACGPGHFTLCLARYLGYQSLLGVDLSTPMVATASKNAAEQGLSQLATFQVGDATRLEQFTANSFNLATLTDAAHHLPDLPTVQRVLIELDRVTKPDGLVMVMDLARLRTKGLTEYYVNTLGADYVDRGLPAFLSDFRNSMYAAWTTNELQQAVPAQSTRSWWQIRIRALPTVQFLLGLPRARNAPFIRGGLPWTQASNPVPLEMRLEWRLLRLSLKFSSTQLRNENARLV